MRLRDFINEGDFQDTLGSIATTLSLLHRRVTEQEIDAEQPTARILRFIRNSGVASFTYHDLIDANERSDGIRNIIANITPKFVKFKTDLDLQASNPGEVTAAAENPQEKVSKMANRALKRRQ